ncbi:MAG: McrB family protein [Anaeroplasmataceae bacterium]
MAIPKIITKQAIENALNYIDQNDIPEKNLSRKYMLVRGNSIYPPLYVLKIANQLLDNNDPKANYYNSVEAVNFLIKEGYKVNTLQSDFTLTITSEEVYSNDEDFNIDDLSYGEVLKPIDTYFESSNGEVKKRIRDKNEKSISNQTLPKLAMQIFESNLLGLSDEEKLNFPTCKYFKNAETIKGIYSNVEEYAKVRKGLEKLEYKTKTDEEFVIYSWSIFSHILFIQECLKRFANKGDKFILKYKTKPLNEIINERNEDDQPNGYINILVNNLMSSKNIILRGAPGTGKTYLSKQIATYIASNFKTSNYNELSKEELEQIEFVQFHPSFDYTDFVEGLRPVTLDNQQVGFELQPGIFKNFISKAKINYLDSIKEDKQFQIESNSMNKINAFFSSIDFDDNSFEIQSGNNFKITNIDEKHIYISIPSNEVSSTLKLKISILKQMLDSKLEFKLRKDLSIFLNQKFGTQENSYYFVLFKEISSINVNAPLVEKTKQKKYVFIIDEINRGEISKIFGELFFSIDPGYRGVCGSISTQYSNLHEDNNEKFYIPENVYIIGTMNDIDRSVDSFDFAMRRRFRFIEVKASDRLEMLDILDDKKELAIAIMNSINSEINKVESLNENYHIGPSYFLKLNHIGVEELWTDFIEPLLQEYIRGMYDEKEILNKLKDSYFAPLNEN